MPTGRWMLVSLTWLTQAKASRRPLTRSLTHTSPPHRHRRRQLSRDDAEGALDPRASLRRPLRKDSLRRRRPLGGCCGGARTSSQTSAPDPPRPRRATPGPPHPPLPRAWKLEGVGGGGALWRSQFFIQQQPQARRRGLRPPGTGFFTSTCVLLSSLEAYVLFLLAVS